MLLNKVVIAEDNDNIAHLVTAALGDAGYLCVRARNGEEAIALVRAHEPDALVCDVIMPKVTGIDVVRRLKADVITSRVPILMLTSLSEMDDKVNGLEAGADDYLTKPFDFRELRARLQALIRGSRRERDRDPTTGLPGAAALDEHLQSRLADRAPFAVAYLELEGLKECFERAGFKAAQIACRRLGEVVLDLSRGRAFVATVGSGDLVAVGVLEDAKTVADEVVSAYRSSSMPPEAQGTAVRGTVIDGTGCQSIDEIAVRIAKAREGALG